MYFFLHRGIIARSTRKRHDKPLPPGISDSSRDADNNRKASTDAAYFYRYRYHLGIHTTDFASRHPRWRGMEITARTETTANAFEN